jgi:hypothetical protein
MGLSEVWSLFSESSTQLEGAAAVQVRSALVHFQVLLVRPCAVIPLIWG